VKRACQIVVASSVVIPSTSFRSDREDISQELLCREAAWRSGIVIRPSTEEASSDRIVLPRHLRRRIGLIAGSGPEAGLDLWAKILAANRALLGTDYKGDIDSPNVVIFSVPTLGLSMELQTNDSTVWRALERTVRSISSFVDFFTIACNTLHYYRPQIVALNLEAKFVDVAEVAETYLGGAKSERVALLGAASVASLDRWSPYKALHDRIGFETPVDLRPLHELIYDIKLRGGEDPSIQARFVEIVGALDSQLVLLSCTELPLVRVPVPAKILVDVSELLAHDLVRRSLYASSI
jgi:aspartate racemase